MSGLGSRLEQALAADGSISVSDADATAYYLAHPEKFQSAGTQGSNAPQAGPRSTAPFQTVEAQVRQLFLDDAFQACLASLAVHATVVRHDDVLAHVPLG
jgi:hypothetical protein